MVRRAGAVHSIAQLFGDCGRGSAQLVAQLQLHLYRRAVRVTHDVSLTKSFEFSGWELRATLLVNNILNQQYEVVQCYPMPGTNFMIKVNFII